MVRRLVLLLMLLPHTGGTLPPIEEPKWKEIEHGLASWYGTWYVGRLTAGGDIFTGRDFTVAHPTLPFNSLLRLTRRDTQRRVTVRVTDRGPYCEYVGSYYYSCKQRRIVDVSERVAEELGFKEQGVTYVSLEILDVD
jgi:rare lipoprotein A